MIEFLMKVLMIFMTLFVILIFLCGCVIAIGVMDWFFDADIKGWLGNQLGERKIFKKIRNRSEEVIKSIEQMEIQQFIPPKPVFPDNVAHYMSKKPSEPQIEDNREGE